MPSNAAPLPCSPPPAAAPQRDRCLLLMAFGARLVNQGLATLTHEKVLAGGKLICPGALVTTRLVQVVPAASTAAWCRVDLRGISNPANNSNKIGATVARRHEIHELDCPGCTLERGHKNR
jgi:hypothetical protein